MSGKVDLHTHSNASDGKLPPGEVVKLAKARGLQAVALTDHDTLDGLQEALKAGCRYGIEFVPGVEISAVLHSREVHILGYYPDKTGELEETLRRFREERSGRMNKMLGKLASLSIRITQDEVNEEAGRAAPGRLHLARVLCRKGYVSSIQEAFSLFLDYGKPVYVARNNLPAAEAMALLKRAGAIPVLAHPGSSLRMESLGQLKAYGLLGIEVFHPKHDYELESILLEWTSREGLLVTGGSDFHDPGETLPGEVLISYGNLELLKQAR